MEKREQGKTITIKINGKHQAFADQKQKLTRRQGQIHENTMVEPVIMKDEEQPKRFITSENENIIENQTISINETAASEEHKEEQFDWILPERSNEIDLQDYKKVDEPNKKKSTAVAPKKSSFKIMTSKSKFNRGVFATIFFAVFLAVILGTSFGFTMLKLVFIEKASDSETAIPTTVIPEEKEPSTKPTGAISLVLPTISTWVVQEGAYANSNSAKSVVDDLKDKGLSATIFEGDKSFILLGVADTKESAKVLSGKLADSNINEPFSKEISTGGNELKGINDQEKAFLEGFAPLFAEMTKATSAEKLADSDLKSLKKASNNLNQLNKIENKQIKSIKAHSQAAIKNIESITKKPDKKQSIELQQHLLSILATYQDLK
ncbi:SPOR domain-containing protein [Bacillus sp. DNRA2]|uniref:SPOR domain-containing protein n=1 Tax=Bacillus sp. DNRA2 TaxID=2723053 RepID=UPI00145D2AE5|nr:SPOR domain-containing protein [Bacillus sp. DNRA2]NMD70545.1 SPOR domain-containing protein [Bacillus sp. DNRA2]